jgi:hypothetical protein
LKEKFSPGFLQKKIKFYRVLFITIFGQKLCHFFAKEGTLFGMSHIHFLPPVCKIEMH